jgi:hypothetical protein
MAMNMKRIRCVGLALIALGSIHSPASALVVGENTQVSAIKELPWITVHLQAVQLADDDGARLTPLDPKKMQVEVDWANVAYKDAHVRFVWDASKDISRVNSTLLNTLEETATVKWPQIRAAGNKEAMRYPGKFVILFRFGTDKKTPVGGSFSWCDLLFVASCSSDGWGTRYWNLAHEMGHNLGLPHPHGGPEFKDVKEAEKYFIEHGRDPKVFDGDGLADTPPFPGIPSTYWDDDNNTITVEGVNFTIPRGNVPSYTFAKDKSKNGVPLTPMQIRRVRWFLELRSKNKMALPTNVGLGDVLEAEALKVVDHEGCNLVNQDMKEFDEGQWSANKQVFVADCKKGSSVSWSFDVGEKGRYELLLGLTHAMDYGQVQVYVDGKKVGKVFDTYGPSVVASGPVSFGRLNLSKGKHEFKLESVGKNMDSQGYCMGLDCLSLVPQK